MKILLVNNNHFRKGGADVVYLNTIELLESKGNEVFNFSKKSERNYFSKFEKYFVDNIDFINASIIKKFAQLPRFIYSFESKKKIKKLIEDHKPEIAHIHLIKGNLTSSIIQVLRDKKIPIVITLHDYGIMCPHNLFLDKNYDICIKCTKYGPVECILNKCNRGNLALSIVSAIEFSLTKIFYNPSVVFDRIINVSKFSYNMHYELVHSIRKNLVHLYNFTPKIYNKDISLIKGDYFLFYGRLSKEKGLGTLIKTWCKLGNSFKLKIVGEGPILSEMKQLGDNLNLTNIEFLGYRDGEELNTLIKNAFFIIIPSEWYENNPMTIIESYTLGKPVIGSNIGGIPEIIIEGKTGFIFKMGDSDSLYNSINKAVSVDEVEYFEMCKSAKLFAENQFDEEKHYIRLMEIYNDAIKHRKSYE